jgi:hypothetical protein
MPLLVTAHAYSQRANPSWLLSNAQESRFYQLLRSLRGHTLAKARGGLPVFGYRGFAVSQLPGGEPSFFVGNGIVDPGSHQASLLDQNRSMESFLLETSVSAIDETLREEVHGALEIPVEKLIELRLRLLTELPAEADCTSTNAAVDAPSYGPSLWNNLSTVRGDNNCYNYANNKPLNKAAIPGRANGVSIVYTSCDGGGPQVPPLSSGPPVDCAVADHLTRAPNFPAKLNKGEGWYVAALLSDKFDDCHWLRQDFSGCWSHKNGEDIVKNIDADGNLITDPRSGNFGKYSIFCAVMITNPKVVIR